jgi:hypothetical protein
VKKSWLTLLSGIALLAAVACGEDAPQSAIGTGPRFPDDEGIATFVSHERIQIDGERNYKITSDVESFKSLEGNEITPLLTWKDKYVHLGVDQEDNSAAWIAGLGIVSPGEPKLVTYVGVFNGVQKGRATFADGTTLRLTEGTEPPEKGVQVVAEINAATDEVLRFRS